MTTLPRLTLLTLAVALLGLALAPSAPAQTANPGGTSFALSLTKQSPAGTLRRDANVTLRLTVRNTGSASASNVQVRVRWPALRFTRGRITSGTSSPAASFSRTGVLLSIASLPAGETRTFSIRLRANRTGSHGISAEVVSPSVGQDYALPVQTDITVALPRPKHTLTVRSIGPRSANRFVFSGRIVGVANCNRGTVVVTGITNRPSPPIKVRRLSSGDCVWGGGSAFTVNFTEVADTRTIRAVYRRGATRLRAAAQRIRILG